MQAKINVKINCKKAQDNSRAVNKKKNNCSLNELPVKMLDPELSRWIRIVKPSRSSLTYERYE